MWDWWVAGVCCLNWKCPGRGRLFFISIADEASVAVDQLVWSQRDKWPRLQLPLESQAVRLSPYGFLLPFIFHLPSKLWYPVGIIDVIFQIFSMVWCLFLKDVVRCLDFYFYQSMLIDNINTIELFRCFHIRTSRIPHIISVLRMCLSLEILIICWKICMLFQVFLWPMHIPINVFLHIKNNIRVELLCHRICIYSALGDIVMWFFYLTS